MSDASGGEAGFELRMHHSLHDLCVLVLCRSIIVACVAANTGLHAQCTACLVGALWEKNANGHSRNRQAAGDW